MPYSPPAAMAHGRPLPEQPHVAPCWWPCTPSAPRLPPGSHGPSLMLSSLPISSYRIWLFDGYRITFFTTRKRTQTEPGNLCLPGTSTRPLRTAPGHVFDDGARCLGEHFVSTRHIITGRTPGHQAVADAVINALTAAAPRRPDISILTKTSP